MSSMTHRPRTQHAPQQLAPEAEVMLAGAQVVGALGNQDLLDLTLPPPAPDEDQDVDPWLAGEGYRTADFLEGLRSADSLVQSFPSSTW